MVTMCSSIASKTSGDEQFDIPGTDSHSPSVAPLKISPLSPLEQNLHVKCEFEDGEDMCMEILRFGHQIP